MTAAVTDKQLVSRVQKGDSRAFDLLVLKYQHKIFGLISRYVRDADEVQDVAQEAFIKAYKALPNFRGDSAFYTWLYRIAINTAKNYLSLGGDPLLRSMLWQSLWDNTRDGDLALHDYIDVALANIAMENDYAI